LWRKDDPRLEQRIELRGHAVHVAQVIQAISRESGVRVELGDERDGAGDDQVSFALPGVTVADAMEALWSLLSYRGSEFHWRRVGRAGAYAYQLYRPLRAQALPAQLQEYTEGAVERELLLLNQAARTSGPELERLARDHEIVRVGRDSRIMLPGVRLFFDVLTPEEQVRVLKAGEQIRKPTSELPRYGRELVDELFNQSGRMGTFGRTVDPIAGPAWVQFYTKHLGVGKLCRSFFIAVEGLGAHGYAGGTPLNRELQAHLYALWLLPGDERESALEHSPIPRAAPDSNRPTARVSARRRVEQLASASPVPFLARLRPTDRRDPGPATGTRLDVFLRNLCEQSNNYQKKWRGGVLLMTAPDWWDAESRALTIPWAKARPVRDLLTRSNGFPSIEELQSIAQLLTAPQLKALADEVTLFEHVAEWRDLLTLRAMAPLSWGRLSSPSGLKIADAAMLGPLLERDGVRNLLGQKGVAAIQFVHREGAAQGSQEPTRFAVLQTIDAQGKPVNGTGFAYRTEAPWGWLRGAAQ
jgi:hypothetical protein